MIYERGHIIGMLEASAKDQVLLLQDTVLQNLVTSGCLEGN